MTDHVTQAAELVERLRRNAAEGARFEICPVLVTQAADLIERLSAELAARSGEAGCALDCREQSDGVRRWYSSAADDWFVCAKHNGHSPRNQQHGGSVAWLRQ